jgi:TolB-like protein/Tfp pilus assembly protein PilF
MNILEEMKRRKVTRVAVVYLVVGWVVIQAADILLENYGAPGWVFQSIGILLLLGFPIACALAWAFDVVPDAGRSETNGKVTTTTTEKWLLPVLFVFIIVLVVDRIWLSTRTVESPAEDPVATGDDSPTLGRRNSIAVLPFENFSSSEKYAYFSDGLSDTILHRLAQLNDLTVIARNSSFTYKGKNVDIRKVGEELNVATVLEGSVQRQGDQLRVIAQLIETGNGTHLWSETFDRKMDDIFAIQDEIAISVAQELSIELVGEDIDELKARGTTNRQAFEIVLQIREALASEEAPTMRLFEDLLPLIRQAIEHDPNYAEAWTVLANLHGFRAFIARSDIEFKDAMDQQRVAIERAMLLQPDSSDALMAYADYLRRNGNFEAALAIATSVLKTAPNSVNALSLVGLTYSANNRFEEALAYFDRAHRIDPLSPFSFRQRGFTLTALGRLEEAEQVLMNGVDRHPDFHFYYSDLADLRRTKGDWLTAIRDDREAEKLNESNPEYLLERCSLMLQSNRMDLFDANCSISGPNAASLEREAMLVRGEYKTANNSLQAYASELGIEDWRSIMTIHCYMADQKDCALKHARAGLRRNIDEFGGFDAQNRNISRAVAVHALAILKWGNEKSLAESILQKVLASTESTPMMSTPGCPLCGQIYVRAELLSILGETDAALEALEASIPSNQNEVYLTGLVFDLPIEQSPFFEPIEQHPRFRKMVEEISGRRARLGAELERVLADLQ